MNKSVLFSGTFDPITKGHTHIIKKALRLFDEVVIAISYNENKKTLFSLEERIELVKKSVDKMSNVRVISHLGGLTVDLAKELNVMAIIKGVRKIDDFNYEQLMAQYGKRKQKEIETILLLTDEKYQLISSSGVKEFFRTGGDITEMVDSHVLNALHTKIKVESLVYHEH